MPRSKPLITHTAPATAERINQLAENDGRSTSSYIERVLEDHIAKVDGKKVRAIRSGRQR
jgi:predicted DNA-binding protein